MVIDENKNIKQKKIPTSQHTLLTDLKEHLLATWNSIPTTYIQRLYSTMPKRIRTVLVQKGSIT